MRRFRFHPARRALAGVAFKATLGIMAGMVFGGAFTSASSSLHAQTNPGAVSAPPGPRTVAALNGEVTLRNFRFDSGGTLPALRMHYRTLGRPQRDARGMVRNAVLILHGTGGAGTQFLGANFAGELFGAGQPLDTTRYYLVLADDIGHGQSSKPSDGLRAQFPHYTYGDMVRAERQLLEEGLGVRHLRLILGTSMGCMHAWVWGTTQPGYADALAPFACLPTQIAGRNRMFRRMAMDDIRLDPAWQGGNYREQPPGLTAALQILFIMGSAPLVQQAQAPTQRTADSVITSFLASRRAATDANDFLYQFDSSRDYDPSPLLERVRVPVLAINSADDEINPPDIRVMERLMPRVPSARYVLIPAGPTTRGHGTHTQAAVWKGELARFLDALPPMDGAAPRAASR